jgi:hypothetical protein
MCRFLLVAPSLLTTHDGDLLLHGKLVNYTTTRTTLKTMNVPRCITKAMYLENTNYGFVRAYLGPLHSTKLTVLH